MIIVPTEKQFTWRYAPVSLCVIVCLNFLLYFGYQSQDGNKFQTALTTYLDNDYLALEWPFYQQYLTEMQDQRQLKELQSAFNAQSYELVASRILMQPEFLEYAAGKLSPLTAHEEFLQWEKVRKSIQHKMDSVSSNAQGLKSKPFKLHHLITHQFMHGGLEHILGNMFFLVLCGFAVEAAIGHWRFLLLYLICGIGGGLAQVLMHPNSTVPLVGASGAISGVMAMYLAIYRFRKIEFFYWFYFLVGYFRAPALLILPFYIGKEIYSYFHANGSPVAFMAHAGGFVTGALVIGLLLLLKPQVLNREYLDSDETLDPKQDALAEIYDAIQRLSFDRALALTDSYCQRFSAESEIAQIRYNLLRLQRGAAFEAAAIHLLTTPTNTFSDLKKMAQVWQLTPEVHPRLSGLQLIKLAECLTQLESPKTSEDIFSVLQSQQCNQVGMRDLALKMAAQYARLGNSHKQQFFLQQAKAYA